MENVSLFHSEPNLSKNCVKMYTLTRGELAKFDETCMKKLQQLLLENKGRDVEAIILSAKLSQNFSGIYYSVSFRTNRPIILWSLGFWGPFNESEGDYQVKVVVAQIHSKFPSSVLSNETILDKFTTAIKCKRRQIFTVHLPQSTLLPENTWIQIKFQLDGPDTAISSSIKGFYDYDDLTFEFFDSSHQLPQINYSLP